MDAFVNIIKNDDYLERALGEATDKEIKDYSRVDDRGILGELHPPLKFGFSVVLQRSTALLDLRMCSNPTRTQPNEAGNGGSKKSRKQRKEV